MNDKKIKIAVIDTGIDLDDKELRGKFKIHPEVEIYDIMDLNGHGTLVSKTILKVCSDIELVPINIFNNDGTTKSYLLMESLNKLVGTDVKLINISASTINQSFRHDIEEVCKKLVNEGKIIISSVHRYDFEKNCIPASFSSVIGVNDNDEIYNDDEYGYKLNETYQMNANSREIFLEYKSGVTHFGRSSKACAVATGIIAKILLQFGDIGYKKVEGLLSHGIKIKGSKYFGRWYGEYLLNEAKIINLSFDELYFEMSDGSKIAIHEKDILYIEDGIKDVINTTFSKSSEDYNLGGLLISESIGISYQKLCLFLKKINEYFDININYKYISLEEIDSYDLLKKLVYIKKFIVKK